MTPRATAWGAYGGIADALRARITDGEFTPGAAMPSESALCAEYGVARNTLRRALDQLAEAGLIATRPGRGRVVVASNDTTAQAVRQYRAMAAQPRELIESSELRPGDPLPSESALAEQYGIARHALAELEGAGLVESIHGKGRFVRER